MSRHGKWIVLIFAAAGVCLTLDTAWLTLQNSDPRYQAGVAVAGGSATLVARGAQVIDVAGALGLDGFAQATLSTPGDLRLQGLLNDSANANTLAGSLTLGGSLTIAAAQTYPTTHSRFTLALARFD